MWAAWTAGQGEDCSLTELECLLLNYSLQIPILMQDGS